MNCTVFLDMNKNEVFDAGEPSALTDTSGSFSIAQPVRSFFFGVCLNLFLGGGDGPTLHAGLYKCADLVFPDCDLSLPAPGARPLRISKSIESPGIPISGPPVAGAFKGPPIGQS